MTKKSLISLFMAFAMLVAMAIPAFASEAPGGTPGGETSTNYTVTSDYDETKGEVYFNTTSAPAGTMIKVTVAPNSGYVVSSVTANDGTNDVPVTTNSSNYTFTMPESNVEVTVEFEEDTYDYDISLVFDETRGYVELSQTRSNAGDEIRISVTPDVGFYIDDIIILDDDNEPIEYYEVFDMYEFVAPVGDVYVEVTFSNSLGRYDITVASDRNKGTVELSRDAADYGDKVKVYVTPVKGYDIYSVKYCRKSNTSTYDYAVREKDYYTFDMPRYDVVVEVTYEANGADYVATLDYDSDYGWAYLNHYSSDAGKTVRVYCDGEVGYAVSSVTVTTTGGAPVEVKNTTSYYWFTMPSSNVTVDIEFEEYDGRYNVNLDYNDDHGTVTLSRSKADEGNTVRIYTDPDAGYDVATVVVRKGTSSTGTRVTLDTTSDHSYFTMPADDVTVYVTFVETDGYGAYSIRLVANKDYGDVWLNQYSADGGDQIRIYTEPDSGYSVFMITAVKGSSGSPITVHHSSSYDYFTMPSANVTVTVIFSKGGTSAGDYDIDLDYDYTMGEVELNQYSGNYDDVITIYAYPDAGCEVDDIYVIDQYGDPVTVKSVSNYVYFVMPDCNVTVYVDFYEDEYEEDYGDYNISLNYDTDYGTVKVKPRTADYGDTVKVYVYPKDGYEFDDFSVVKTSNKSVKVDFDDEGAYYSFVMPRYNVTVNVDFYESDGDYNVDLSFDEDYGYVSVFPRNADKGDTVKVYVSPNTGITVDSVKAYKDSNNVSVSPVSSTSQYYYFTMPSDNVTVYVTFNGKVNNGSTSSSGSKHDVDVFFDESYGEASLSHTTAKKGTTVTVTTECYGSNSVKNVYVINSKDGTVTTARKSGTNYTFSMPDDDVLVDVVFKAEALGAYGIQYDYAEDEGKVKGSATSSGRNTDIRFYVTPNEGYVIDKVTVTRKDTGRVISFYDLNDFVYNFSMPNSDVKVSVTFQKKSVNYAVNTIIDTTKGSATLSTVAAPAGTTVKVTPTAKTGYLVDKVTVTEYNTSKTVTVTEANGVYSFKMPSASVNVKVTFKAQPVSYYIVAKFDKTMGDVSLSSGFAAPGSTVTVTVKPDDEYAVASVSGKQLSNGTTIFCTPGANGTYTFAMPQDNVEISVTFNKTEHVCKIDKFDDIDVNEWYHSAIDYVVKNGIMNGVGKDANGKEYFDPKGTTTKAMVTTVLWRIAGAPKSTAPLPYSDIKEGEWYTEAVRWAAANGLLAHVAPGNEFTPNSTITREQVADMIYLFEQYKAGGNLEKPAYQLNFSDVSLLSDWAKDSMNWCNVNGIINGNTNGTLNPKGSTTRAEIAQILLNYKDFN